MGLVKDLPEGASMRRIAREMRMFVAGFVEANLFPLKKLPTDREIRIARSRPRPRVHHVPHCRRDEEARMQAEAEQRARERALLREAERSRHKSESVSEFEVVDAHGGTASPRCGNSRTADDTPSPPPDHDEPDDPKWVCGAVWCVMRAGSPSR